MDSTERLQSSVTPGSTETNPSDDVEMPTDPESIEFDVSTTSEVPMCGPARRDAGAIAFCCSDDASYVTGRALPVDGGQAAD